MIENVPVMMAWLPTTAARMAITRTGHLSFSASIWDTSDDELKLAQHPNYLIIIDNASKSTYLVQTHKTQLDNDCQERDAVIDRQLAPYMQESRMDIPKR